MFFASWLLLEKPRGLDFSLRSKVNMVDGYNGYAMTSESALKNIAEIAPIKGKRFLDVGSGKGAVVVNAIKLGAKVSAGLEFNRELHSIAEKNFKVLGKQHVAKSINVDALEFLEYKNYNYYFLFNPFDSEVYSKVVECILDQTLNSTESRFLVCYGDAALDFLSFQSRLQIIHSSICPFRLNEINVFRID